MPARRKRPAVRFVDLTRDEQENIQRPSKILRKDNLPASRVNAAHRVNATPLANLTNIQQRAGEDFDYISSSQIDDDDFNSIVPASQAVDDVETTSYQPYGIAHPDFCQWPYV